MALFGKTLLGKEKKFEKKTAEKSTPDVTRVSLPPAYSSIAPLSASFKSKFASLSLHMTDLIRLLHFPSDVALAIQRTIMNHWDGIQDVGEYGGAYQFKLRGRPWSGWGEEALHARRLMREIFRTLYDHGWVLTLSTDISRKTRDKDTLVFRHQDPAPARRDWMSISFARGDKIHLIDAPPEFTSSLFNELHPIIHKSKQILPGVHEFQMGVSLWWATGTDTMKAREVVLQMMEVLERHGFTIYASIDQDTRHSDTSSETDSWTCCRPSDWRQGAPVYHG